MKITINEQTFLYTEVYKSTFIFSKENTSPVVCRDCREGIGAGMGIYRQSYKRNGYLCFSCFCKNMTILTTGPSLDGGTRDAGFYIDSIGRLRACCFNSPTVSTLEVLEAVYRSLLEKASSSIEIFTPRLSLEPAGAALEIV
jgi:hypothetical protein